jgi:hypothetical protein
MHSSSSANRSRNRWASLADSFRMTTPVGRVQDGCSFHNAGLRLLRLGFVRFKLRMSL